MRALILIATLAACSPEVVSGAYLCGPDASCPEGQTCNGADHLCVLPISAQPFTCDPEVASEPDDTIDNAYVLDLQQCSSLPLVLDSCMPETDTSDWVKLTAPASCTAVGLEARVTFPLAFEELGLELWDLARNERIATDTACTAAGESGDELRCLQATLTPGSSYGIHIAPTGDGDCAGRCAYNSYTLRVQLVTPR